MDNFLGKKYKISTSKNLNELINTEEILKDNHKKI